jgi:hypothetical protein
LTDFLDQKKAEIRERLKEIKPLVDEYERLLAAERALSGVQADSSGSRAPRPQRSSNGNGRRRRGGGRPKGSGTRGTQALELVRSRPGITIPELAEAMEIQQNYLYRVMPDLAEQGLVTKSGRGWHVKE